MPSSNAAALRRMYETGRGAWPEVALDEAVFGEHVSTLLEAQAALVSDPTVEATLEELHPADLYLACACARGDPQALAIFDDRLLARIVGHLARWETSADFRAELAQVVRERLLVGDAGKGTLPRIAHYSGRGSLSGWVMATAGREAIDLRRKLRRQPHGADQRDDEAGVASSNPEIDLLRRQYGDVVSEALRAAIVALDPHEATLLRLYFLEGLDPETIASLYRMSKRSVRRRVLDARRKILDETRRLLTTRLGGSPTQVESLIRLVRADLQPSLVKLLRK